MTCLVLNSFLASAVPALSSATYTDTQINPTDALSTLTLDNTGVMTHNVGGVVAGQWLTSISATAAALYELQVVITSGTAFNAAGTTAAGSGTWRDMASSWMYGNTFTGSNGTKSTIATFTIRRKSDLVTMATASIQIDATVTP